MGIVDQFNNVISFLSTGEEGCENRIQDLVIALGAVLPPLPLPDS